MIFGAPTELFFSFSTSCLMVPMHGLRPNNSRTVTWKSSAGARERLHFQKKCDRPTSDRSTQNISDVKIGEHPPHTAHGSWQAQQRALAVTCLGSSSLKDVLLGRSAQLLNLLTTLALWSSRGVGIILLLQRTDTPALWFSYWIVCTWKRKTAQ